MPIAPSIKSTSGEGFTVEEKVVAWLASYLLSGTPWTSGGGGLIVAIDCQARQSGWFFDDTVVTIEQNSRVRKCGCSIKSYSVFGPDGAPSDFRDAVWSQWENDSET